MVSLKDIKLIAKNNNKKIGKKAIKRINYLLKNTAEKIIRRSSKNSDFYGRSTIKPEDIKEVL